MDANDPFLTHRSPQHSGSSEPDQQSYRMPVLDSPYNQNNNNSGQHDPFNYGSGGNSNNKNTRHVSMQQNDGSVGKSPWRQRNYKTSIVFSTLLPFSLFAAIVLNYCYIYHHAAFLANIIVYGLAGAVLSGLAILMFGCVPIKSHSHKIWYTGFILNCLFAVIAGVAIGLYTYHSSYFYYWSINAGNSYDNVQPIQVIDDPLSYPDASIFTYSQDTKLQLDKALGLHGVDRVYCVVPVTDGSDVDANNVIQYFAVGMDCCNDRASFRCDSASDNTAFTGVVVPDQDAVVFGSTNEQYRNAITQATAVYDLSVSDNPTLVRWAKDASVIQSEYLREGILTCLYGGCVFLFVNFAVACLTHRAAKQQMSVGR